MQSPMSRGWAGSPHPHGKFSMVQRGDGTALPGLPGRSTGGPVVRALPLQAWVRSLVRK